MQPPFNFSNFTSLQGWLQLALHGYPAWLATFFLPAIILTGAFAIWLRTRNVTPAVLYMLVLSSVGLTLAGKYISPAVHALLYFCIGLSVAWLIYLALK